MTMYHNNLSQGAWHRLSLVEQMANIGSEVSRAKKWRGKHEQYFNNAIDRCLELIDLTINDARRKNQLKEILRVREILIDAISEKQHYDTSLNDLDKYFLAFARAARV